MGNIENCSTHTGQNLEDVVNMNPPYFNISFEIISGDVLFPLLRDLIAALISCVVISLSKMLSNVSFPSFSFNNSRIVE
jgi:hypothetical protein